MKRLKMLDYSRGFAILSMMFFHSFQFYEGDLNQIASDMSSNPISKVFRFFGRWAGLFVIISGFAFAYVTYSLLFEGIIKPKPMIKQTVSFGSALIIVEKVINFFFHRTNRGGGIYGFNEGPYHYSLILGSLETGKLQIPDLYSAIFSMGAVTAI